MDHAFRLYLTWSWYGNGCYCLICYRWYSAYGWRRLYAWHIIRCNDSRLNFNYYLFKGTLSAWWTKIVIGLLLSLFIVMQAFVNAHKSKLMNLKAEGSIPYENKQPITKINL